METEMGIDGNRWEWKWKWKWKWKLTENTQRNKIRTF